MKYTFGDNDYLVLGAGWHPLQEGPGGVQCRWMSPKAVLRIPDDETGVTGIRMQLTAPGIIEGFKPGLSVHLADQRLAHETDLGQEGQWHTVEIRWPSPVNGELFLDLVVENADPAAPSPLRFLPGIVLGNGDIRELGIQAARLEFLKD